MGSLPTCAGGPASTAATGAADAPGLPISIQGVGEESMEAAPLPLPAQSKSVDVLY